MKKIINGKMYNTDTANQVGWHGYSNRRDFCFFCETLYQKKTGEFFLHGEGGANSKYRTVISHNCWGGGEKIIPMTDDEAREWVETYLDADTYVMLFGEPEE